MSDRIKAVHEPRPCYEVDIEVSKTGEEPHIYTVQVIQMKSGKFVAVDQGDFIIIRGYGEDRFSAEVQELIDELPQEENSL